MRRGFTAAWIVWALAFVAVEAVAVFSPKRGDTLSEHIWHLFRINAAPVGWLSWVLRVFLLWLSLHLGTGWV